MSLPTSTGRIMMARAMPANADFVVEVDAAALAWLDSHKSEGPRVITYDVHRCCGGGKICDVRVRETAHRCRPVMDSQPESWRQGITE